MIAPEALREKLTAPRALVGVGAALYGAPLAGSTTAWIAHLEAHDDDTLRAVLQRARHDGARRVAYGGPPGNYLVSGVETSETELAAWLVSRGFSPVSSHVDLIVATEACTAYDDVSRLTGDGAGVCAWFEAHFASAWAMEAARAHGHHGVFVARSAEGELLGAACHSGNNAHAGTFGPIGVLPDARGTGLGRRLAETVLADLAARGHTTARVPWVDGATARFYRSFGSVLREETRVMYRLDLDEGA